MTADMTKRKRGKGEETLWRVKERPAARETHKIPRRRRKNDDNGKINNREEKHKEKCEK